MAAESGVREDLYMYTISYSFRHLQGYEMESYKFKSKCIPIIAIMSFELSSIEKKINGALKRLSICSFSEDMENIYAYSYNIRRYRYSIERYNTI